MTSKLNNSNLFSFAFSQQFVTMKLDFGVKDVQNMKKKWSNLLKGNDRRSLTVYFILRFLIIICMIR